MTGVVRELHACVYKRTQKVEEVRKRGGGRGVSIESLFRTLDPNRKQRLHTEIPCALIIIAPELGLKVRRKNESLMASL